MTPKESKPRQDGALPSRAHYDPGPWKDRAGPEGPRYCALQDHNPFRVQNRLILQTILE